MGLGIDPALSALAPQREVAAATSNVVGNLRQLGAQQRITQAADDAAGLFVAETFRTDVRQAAQEVNNFQDGANFLQTAEANLAQQGEGVARLRELAVQASNGTLNADQRAALNNEAQQILSEIGAVGNQAEFNGRALLDGSATGVTLDAEGSVEVSVGESTVASLGLNGFDVSTPANANAAISAADAAADQINQNRSNVGAQQNRVESAINQRETERLNATAPEAQLRDLDVARASVDQARDALLLQNATNVLRQGGLQSDGVLRLLSG